MRSPAARPRPPRARAGSAVAALLAVALVAGRPHGAAAEPRLRLESGAGFDTNLTRAEGSSPQREGALARLVLDLEHDGRLGRVHHALAWQGGAKHFFDRPAEDVVFHRLAGQVTVRATEVLRPGLRASFQDRTSRDPERPRDYTRVAGGPTLDAALGPVTTGIYLEGERLVFKPDARFDADALGGGLHLGLRLGDAVAASVRGGYTARRFDGPRALDGGELGAYDDPDGVLRSDGVWSAGASLRGLGAWLWTLEYGYADNRSNSFNGSFVRHEVGASATFGLPLGLLASVKGSLQRLTYADVIALSPLEVLSDENRSAVSGRLELPFDDHWSAVLSGGGWFSPFGTGAPFTRYTGVLGLAFNDG